MRGGGEIHFFCVGLIGQEGRGMGMEMRTRMRMGMRMGMGMGIYFDFCSSFLSDILYYIILYYTMS